MSKVALMNQDSIDATSHLSMQRILDLNEEVVECRACRRLVEYRESVARVKKKQSELGLLGPTCSRFRRYLRFDSCDRACSSTSWRESDWKSVHWG
jgi:hypothetical protein